MDKHYYLDPPLYIEVYGVSVDFGGTGPKSSEPPNFSHSKIHFQTGWKTMTAATPVKVGS